MIERLLRPREQKKRRRHDADGVIRYPDGREVCNTNCTAGSLEYSRRKELMFQRQSGMCSLCKPSHSMNFETAVFEHSDGRGLGGGHRDDRIEKDGKPYNSLACWWSNAEKGSKRA